jgi:Macrocin-O-methyltransferase (TylF)
MLRRILGSIGRTPATPAGGEVPPAAAAERPEDARDRRLAAAHAGVSIGLHRRIQFDGLSVAGLEFRGLVDECLRDSSTGVGPLKAFHRYQAALILARYFVHTFGVLGERAECGVYSGFGSLLMCRLMRARHPGFDGTGFHLVDSFEGLSPPSAADAVELRETPGRGTVGVFGYDKDGFTAPIEYARAAMRDFPGARIHKGWIPAVLATLPDARFAFVHVDVDLYEPTLACLEHFYPRLADGGAIVCDDYGAPRFPGAARAWDEYCDRHRIPYVVLDTGQSILLRE